MKQTISVLALTASLAACADSPSGPSDGSRASAHTVTAAGVTVSFSLQTAPPRGAAVGSGDEVIVHFSCSTAADSDLWLTVVIDPIAPDGSFVPAGAVPSLGGMVSGSIALSSCRTGFSADWRAALPSAPFTTIARLRTKAFLRARATQDNVGSLLASTPDTIVFDDVNWRRQ